MWQYAVVKWIRHEQRKRKKWRKLVFRKLKMTNRWLKRKLLWRQRLPSLKLWIIFVLKETNRNFVLKEKHGEPCFFVGWLILPIVKMIGNICSKDFCLMGLRIKQAV